MNQEDFEKAATMMQLSTFVMKSAIAFLIPEGKTLSELGFNEVLSTSIDDDAIKSVIDTPEKHQMFKTACLKVAAELDSILINETINAKSN